MRILLGIENHPIVNNRHLRNALKHIDERLEKYTATRQFIIINKNYGSASGMVNLNGNPYDISKVKNYRHFGYMTNTYYFYCERLVLDDAFKVVDELNIKIKEYKNQL